MKIALLNPPYLPGFSRFSRSPAVTRSGTIYYPIWHAYAAGLLEREGHEVMLIDAPAQRLTMTDCLSLIKDFSPGMTAVYTSTPSIVNDIECAAAIKIIMPSSFMALTGPHVSALPDQTLSMDERIDAVAIGEYDLTLLELASTIESGGDIDGVPGLVIRTNGKVEPTAARAHIEDLDSLPFVSSVYKRHARIEDYFYAHCRYPVVSIFTSRGCAARCDYCVYPQTVFGRRHRQRSPENIVEEFRYIEKELPQTKEVLIDDDTFSFDKAHTLEFAELMIRSRVKLPWTVECRANLDFETLSAMKRAGCRLVVAGFESADDAILRNIKKGITVERMRRFALDARRAGIMIHACFMAGNRGETMETLKRTLAFAKEIRPDTCQFFPLMVYPGTEAYAWARGNGYLESEDFPDWLTPEGLHNCLVSTPELSARELVEFCDFARRSFYLAPGYISYKVRRLLAEPREMRRTAKSARIFLKHLMSGNKVKDAA